MPKIILTMTEALDEIFSISPLPNRLKTPKARWQEGKLGPTAAIRIIEEYTEWTVEVRVHKTRTRKKKAL